MCTLAHKMAYLNLTETDAWKLLQQQQQYGRKSECNSSRTGDEMATIPVRRMMLEPVSNPVTSNELKTCFSTEGLIRWTL